MDILTIINSILIVVFICDFREQSKDISKLKQRVRELDRRDYNE